MLSLPSNIKRTALVHMTINLTVVGLFAINAWMRRGGVTDGMVWLSAFSIVLLAISGWLGGKMVYVHGVAVDASPEPERAPAPKHRLATESGGGR